MFPCQAPATKGVVTDAGLLTALDGRIFDDVRRSDLLEGRVGVSAILDINLAGGAPVLAAHRGRGKPDDARGARPHRYRRRAGTPGEVIRNCGSSSSAFTLASSARTERNREIASDNEAPPSRGYRDSATQNARSLRENAMTR
jgi:hypothetical protein